MSFWLNLGYVAIAIEEARGHASGIWVLSNDLALKCSMLDTMHQVVTISFNDGDKI